MSSSSSKSNKRSYAKSNEKNIDEKEIENILLNKKKKRSKKQYNIKGGEQEKSQKPIHPNKSNKERQRKKEKKENDSKNDSAKNEGEILDIEEEKESEKENIKQENRKKKQKEKNKIINEKKSKLQTKEDSDPKILKDKKGYKDASLQQNENYNREVPKEKYGICVKGINFSIKEEELRKLFGNCEKIININVTMTKDGFPCAFIDFDNKESIKKALEKNGTKFEGKKLIITENYIGENIELNLNNQFDGLKLFVKNLFQDMSQNFEKRIKANEDAIKRLNIKFGISNEIARQTEIKCKLNDQILNSKLNNLINAFKVLYLRKLSNLIIDRIVTKHKDNLAKSKKIFGDGANKFSIIIAKKDISEISKYHINLLLDFLYYMKSFCSRIIHLKKKGGVNYEKEIFYGLLDQYLGEKSQNSMKNKGIIDIDDVINLIFKKNTKLEKVEIPTHRINKFDDILDKYIKKEQKKERECEEQENQKKTSNEKKKTNEILKEELGEQEEENEKEEEDREEEDSKIENKNKGEYEIDTRKRKTAKTVQKKEDDNKILEIEQKVEKITEDFSKGKKKEILQKEKDENDDIYKLLIKDEEDYSFLDDDEKLFDEKKLNKIILGEYSDENLKSSYLLKTLKKKLKLNLEARELLRFISDNKININLVYETWKNTFNDMQYKQAANYKCFVDIKLYSISLEDMEDCLKKLLMGEKFSIFNLKPENYEESITNIIEKY